MLTSEKEVDFSTKKITRQKGRLYNDQKVNPPRKYSNFGNICTKQQLSKMCEVKIKRIEEYLKIQNYI